MAATGLRNLTGISEIELVLSCGRLQLNSATEDRICEICREPIDWSKVLDFAEWHNLTGLMQMHLARICPELVPANILKSMKVRFIEVARRSVMMSENLVEIVREFNAHEVACLPFGNLFVGETFYDDFVLTPCSDIDIFVPEAQLVKAQDILANHGYLPARWKEHCELPDQLFRSACFARMCDRYTFVREPDNIFITLTWRFKNSALSNKERDPLSLPRKQWSIAGKPIETFSSEVMLLLLCSEASLRAWQKIGWVGSVAESTKSNLNWQEVYKLAKSLGIERALLLGLYLTKYLPQSSIPDNLRERICELKEIAGLGDSIIRNYYGLLDDKTDAYLSNGAYYLRLQDTWFDRFALLLARHTRPTIEDCRRNFSPAFPYALYYLVHQKNQVNNWFVSRLIRSFVGWKSERQILSDMQLERSPRENYH
jgi:hypothetical protein